MDAATGIEETAEYEEALDKLRAERQAEERKTLKCARCGGSFGPQQAILWETWGGKSMPSHWPKCQMAEVA